MLLSEPLTKKLKAQGKKLKGSSVRSEEVVYPSGDIAVTGNSLYSTLKKATSKGYAYWACPTDNVMNGCSDTSPSPGTVTISYTATTYDQVSVIGKLAVLDGGAALGAFQVKGKHGGQEQQHIEPGKVSFEDLLDHAESELSSQTWGYRVLGWFVLWIGAMLILMPAAVMADQFPVLGPCMGDLAECAICLVSCSITIPITLTTIAICWLSFRPIIGGPILAGGFVLALAGFCGVKKHRDSDGIAYSSVPQSF